MVGSWQVDAVANHQHDWDHFFYWFNFRGADIACHQPSDSPNLQNNTKQATNNDGGVKTAEPGKETRPKNVYVLLSDFLRELEYVLSRRITATPTLSRAGKEGAFAFV